MPQEEIIKRSARLGAMEILIRNLYALRFANETDPIAAANKAMEAVRELSKDIRVFGPEPVINDMLAAEAEDFLISMFDEIVRMVQLAYEQRGLQENRVQSYDTDPNIAG